MHALQSGVFTSRLSSGNGYYDDVDWIKVAVLCVMAVVVSLVPPDRVGIVGWSVYCIIEVYVYVLCYKTYNVIV